MLLRVDADLPLPVYEQIRVQVARLAVSGQTAAGTRLPTIRQLASDLGLSKGTVERAYELLEGDGVVEPGACRNVPTHPPDERCRCARPGRARRGR